MKNRTIRNVYVFTALWNFSRSLIMFFLPVYLYSIGFDIPSLLKMYLVQMIVIIPIVYLTGYLVSKKGYKLPLLISIPFKLGVLILAYLINLYAFSILWVGVVAAIGAGFSDVTQSILYSNNTIKKTRGKELGTIESFIILGSFLGPLIGGVLFKFFSFYYILAISGAFLLSSLIPLSTAKNYTIQKKYEIISIISKIKNARYIFLFFFEGLYYLSIEFIYPLLLATLFTDYVELGVLGSLAPLALIIFALIIGNRLDKTQSINLLKIAGVFLLIIWILKASITNIAFIAIAMFAGGFIDKLFVLPKNKMIYDWAHKLKKFSEVFVVEEETSFISRIIVILIALSLPNPLIVILGITAASSIYYVFIKKA